MSEEHSNDRARDAAPTAPHAHPERDRFGSHDGGTAQSGGSTNARATSSQRKRLPAWMLPDDGA